MSEDDKQSDHQINEPKDIDIPKEKQVQIFPTNDQDKRAEILKIIRPEGKAGRFHKFTETQLLFITDLEILDLLKDMSQLQKIEYFKNSLVFKDFTGTLN